MASNTSRMSALPVLCTSARAVSPAHASVGFLAVQADARGGLLLQGPRFTKFDVQIQQTNGAYGIGVSAANGSPKTVVPVPAGATERGVPPRGRPV
jgi:hypothetical protein